MNLYTIESLKDKEYTEIKMVMGSMVLSKSIGKDISAGLKGLVGGEVKGYSKMLDEAREEAISRMVKEAKKEQADAIIGVRFATSSVKEGAAEILVYGTTIKYI